MSWSNNGHSRRRRYNVNLIKLSCSYDPAEVAKLLGIHRNTVRHWLKGGLTPLDNRRPILVSGAALKAFIRTGQQARRQKCAPGEFFCFRCRAPRRPWGGLADFSVFNEKIVKAVAFCSVCETAMHRTIQVPRWDRRPVWTARSPFSGSGANSSRNASSAASTPWSA